MVQQPVMSIFIKSRSLLMTLTRLRAFSRQSLVMKMKNLKQTIPPPWLIPLLAGHVISGMKQKRV